MTLTPVKRPEPKQLRAHVIQETVDTVVSAEAARLAEGPEWLTQSQENHGLPLSVERSFASFPVWELTHYLFGGRERAEHRERLMSDIERDPSFMMLDLKHDLPMGSVREATLRRARNFTETILEEHESVTRMRFDVLAMVDPSFMTRVGVHYALFWGTIRGQGTTEQIVDLASQGMLLLKDFFGCFAMTELGHGSNVAGLQTTATFMPESDEFELHTPSLLATKWWIGGAAESATHAVVFARLLSNGTDYGVRPFVVQLRHPQDFALCFGVTIGDCGAKMGRHGIDNGWIQFNRVRIPRRAMLARHVSINRAGVVRERARGSRQLAYGALITARVQIAVDASNACKRAITIAVRYAAVRRQFSPHPEAPETRLLDYPSHQARLMPLLADAFAIHFAAERTQLQQQACSELLEAVPESPLAVRALADLKALHGTASGLKAHSTWLAQRVIEECRQSLGGHGYSSYAGLASLQADFVVQCTWDGDNTVMALQCGRYLVACWRDRTGRAGLSSNLAYLATLEQALAYRSPARRAADFQRLDLLVQLYSSVCAHLVDTAGVKIEQYLSPAGGNMSPDEAYREAAPELLRAARAHCLGYMLRQFAEAVTAAPASLRPPLEKLCALFGLHHLIESAGALCAIALEKSFLSPEQLRDARDCYRALMPEIRADAVPLVDSFALPDFILASPFGRYDGDVYRAYFDRVKFGSTLSNEAARAAGGSGDRRATSGPVRLTGQEHPYFESQLKPLFRRTLPE
ncbi:hypothetical protein H696_02263 [Fonticula alba]|uniref:Acyl-coenzyme A oxidase n=1 Tax=Fonticula alba TaxID=691883 RepID=A0A058ZD02_FONAL|nr:hypothetical protein H696_02263 [Fonticula alba]KCV71317.1 hypothetical protein H696_02263 [Fonticula alba]|eukprot:XP_009494440.1 hypothetical protein H696_02263 [Fonticula alba]